MRKTTKGAIAVGAGAALLLGGAGTMAAWQLTSTAAAGAVASGDFNLVTTGGATKYWGTVTGADQCTVPAIPVLVTDGAKLVPGDCVVYTQPMTLTASGDRLEARLTVTAVPDTGTTWSGLTAKTVTTLNSYPGLVIGDGSSYTFSPGRNGINEAGKAVTTIIFDPATSGNAGQGSSVTLGGIRLVLQQTQPTGP